VEITTLDRYQMEALRTASSHATPEERFSVLALGLSEGAGGVAHRVRLALQGEELDENRVFYELGDILWYVANMADYLGVSMSEVATANIDKLKARYSIND